MCGAEKTEHGLFTQFTERLRVLEIAFSKDLPTISEFNIFIGKVPAFDFYHVKKAQFFKNR